MPEVLQALSATFGSTAALAIFAWWYERRANRELQRRLLKLVEVQLRASAEIRTSIEAIRKVTANHD